MNAKLAGYERLQFLAVVRDRWTIEAGFLTPTMKIRRGPIEDLYGPMLDAWYESGQSVIFEE